MDEGMDDTIGQWLTIIGIGEDGVDGLSLAARTALVNAKLVMGSARHLALLPEISCPTIEWPVPFANGMAQVQTRRGTPMVVLASGDPFWFGAGASLAHLFAPSEWIAHPAPSTFALAAARLGWAIQDSLCLGLHAAPLDRLRPHLAPGRRIMVLIRDSMAVTALAAYLVDRGFGSSRLHVMEGLGGPRERRRSIDADQMRFTDITHPVMVAMELCGTGPTLPSTPGRPDSLFASDGQLTKAPVRALTLAALAPSPGELLWDIGAGSGSVAIEWLLAHPANRAIAVEADTDRADRARANALALGVDRLQILRGHAPALLPDGDAPDAVFIGGGLSQSLLESLEERLPSGTRLIANAVTLESEALLTAWQARRGGTLLRIELADARPLGNRHGWRARYPIVQWSVTL